MILKVTSLNANGELLTLDVKGARVDTGLLLISSEGLSPPPGIVNVLDGASFDGSKFNSKKVDKRTISLSIALTTTGTSEDEARLQLYESFPVSEPITFGVESNVRDATITAYVESNDIHMFSKIENATIELICPFPFFADVEEELVWFSGTTPLFEFPWSNESTSESLIEFGEIVEYAVKFIEYTGDVSTGMLIRASARGDVQDIKLYNATIGQVMVIDTDVISNIIGSPAMVAGDTIEIDTRVGSKMITLIRGGISYDISNSLGLYSPWLKLVRGTNEVSFSAGVGQDLLDVGMYYNRLYTGV